MAFLSQHKLSANRYTAKHRQSVHRTPEYVAWLGMRTRCFDTAFHQYHDYGGRGITICDTWADSFDGFFKDMGERPSPVHSLDRIDNSKGYSPKNCRWATKKEQQNNNRNNVVVLYHGKSQTLMQWTEELNLNYSKVWQRIKRYGWSPERAFE